MWRRPHWLALTLASLILGLWTMAMAATLMAASGDETAGVRLVAFSPQASPDEMFTAILSSGARPVGPTGFSFVWVVDIEAGGARRLRDEGALLVLRELPVVAALTGCTVVPHEAIGGLYARFQPFR